MAHLQDILDRYTKLCAYCDAFWQSVFKRFPPQECACAAGCSTCCELSSVNYLEAFAIADHCARNPGGLSACPSEASPALPAAGPCPFLTDDRCRIYPVRPLICRTHGLLLKSDGFTDHIVASCPFNFTTLDFSRIDPALALDTDAITTNLARLNTAFCMMLGDVAQTQERIALRDLASGTIGPARFTPLQNEGTAR